LQYLVKKPSTFQRYSLKNRKLEGYSHKKKQYMDKVICICKGVINMFKEILFVGEAYCNQMDLHSFEFILEEDK